MQNTKYKMQNAKYKIQNTKYKITTIQPPLNYCSTTVKQQFNLQP